MSPTETVS